MTNHESYMHSGHSRITTNETWLLPSHEMTNTPSTWLLPSKQLLLYCTARSREMSFINLKPCRGQSVFRKELPLWNHLWTCQVLVTTLKEKPVSCRCMWRRRNHSSGARDRRSLGVFLVGLSMFVPPGSHGAERIGFFLFVGPVHIGLAFLSASVFVTCVVPLLTQGLTAVESRT